MAEWDEFAGSHADFGDTTVDPFWASVALTGTLVALTALAAIGVVVLFTVATVAAPPTLVAGPSVVINGTTYTAAAGVTLEALTVTAIEADAAIVAANAAIAASAGIPPWAVTILSGASLSRWLAADAAKIEAVILLAVLQISSGNIWGQFNGNFSPGPGGSSIPPGFPGFNGTIVYPGESWGVGAAPGKVCVELDTGTWCYFYY